MLKFNNSIFLYRNFILKFVSHYAPIFCYYVKLCSSLVGELLCSKLCRHNVPRPTEWSSSPQILTVVSSLSDYCPQHSPHSYFHVIFISAYPAVRVTFYAYVNMLGRNDLITNLLEKKAVCKPATTRREETNAGTTQMTALVKGSTC